jgi:esterase/lipase
VLTLYRLWFRIGAWLWPAWAAKQAFTLFITPQARSQKPLPSIFQQAEALQLIESGDKCQGWRWNMGGSSRVLILHGFSSSARNFAHLIEALRREGVEVIAFDAPAHGDSEGKTIHSLRYRKLIQSIRATWGPIDGYIAHSFGGLSLSLALDEQPPQTADRVVLIAPATETRSALQQLQATLQLSPNIMKRIDVLIEQKSDHPTSWFSVNRVARTLTNPILWVHDRNDDITPYDDIMPTIQLKLPNIRFVTTAGLGHRRIYRDEQVCQEIIHFLVSKKQ